MSADGKEPVFSFVCCLVFFVVRPKAQTGRPESELPSAAQTAKNEQAPSQTEFKTKPGPKQQNKQAPRQNNKKTRHRLDSKKTHPRPNSKNTYPPNSKQTNTPRHKQPTKKHAYCLGGGGAYVKHPFFSQNQALAWRDEGKGWGTCFF